MTRVSGLASGYSVGSLISSGGSQLYVAGAPRFNHTGKVIVFTLKNSGNLTVLQALLGEQVTHTAWAHVDFFELLPDSIQNVFLCDAFLSQIGSYFGSELLSIDVDGDGKTDVLLVAAPMFYSQGWERGKVYIYTVTPQVRCSCTFLFQSYLVNFSLLHS